MPVLRKVFRHQLATQVAHGQQPPQPSEVGLSLSEMQQGFLQVSEPLSSHEKLQGTSKHPAAAHTGKEISGLRELWRQTRRGAHQVWSLISFRYQSRT